MQIECLELGPIGTNAYLLWDRAGGEAVLVDAPPGAAEAWGEIQAERGGRLTALLLTHGHWDHMLDMKAMGELGAKVYGHEADRILFEQPGLMASYAFPGLKWEGGTVDHWVKGGERLRLLGREVEVREVPGHCPGNVLYYFPSEGLALVGDALFAGGVGRYDLPGGDWETLEKSIREQIYTLPGETVVLPGHGPATTVERERRTNPYVRG